MAVSAENLMMACAAIEPDAERLAARIAALLPGTGDVGLLAVKAERLGVAACFLDRLGRVGSTGHPLALELRAPALREIDRTVAMLGAYRRLAGVLDAARIAFMPLKGCDPRVAAGARRTANPMHDIDILVRLGDLAHVRGILGDAGYIYGGSHGGAHENYLSGDEAHVMVEVHYDLVNRANPLHRALFNPDIEAVWTRAGESGGTMILSPADLACHLAAHGVKEYFRRPRWLADVAWALDELIPAIGDEDMGRVAGEWGVGAAFGLAALGLAAVTGDAGYYPVRIAGAVDPGVVGRIVAVRLAGYGHMKTLRPLIFAASAHGVRGKLALAAAGARRALGVVTRAEIPGNVMRNP